MSKDIFSNNPTIDLYYKTSDGTPFFTKNVAQNHAKTLEDKSVSKVTRTSLKTAVLVTDGISAKDEVKEPKKGKTVKTEQETVKDVKEPDAEKANTTVQEQPTAPADQVKDEGSADTGASQDDSIEDSVAEYNQAVSDYKEKFGEAPFEGAELNKIKWAVQFNKKLAKS